MSDELTFSNLRGYMPEITDGLPIREYVDQIWSGPEHHACPLMPEPYSTGQSVTGMWWSRCHRCPHHCLTSTKAAAEAAAETHQKTHEKESNRR